MEIAVVLVALVVAAFLVARGAPSDQSARIVDSAGYPYPALPAAHEPTPRPILVPGAPPLRIFTPSTTQLARGGPAEPGTEYSLALARTGTGQWSSVLRAPEVVSDGGALTVTLLIPWRELAERYSAVNLVVR